jgi:hypothetical protein
MGKTSVVLLMTKVWENVTSEESGK